jgi:hypothetical protein
VATVNGSAVTLGQFDQQLEAWSSSPAYVSEENLAFEVMARDQESEGETNVQVNTVGGQGSGAGVYGMFWSALELTDLVTARAVAMYLARHKEAATVQQVAAAWDAEYARDPLVWRQVPAEARDAAALQDAQRAIADGKLATTGPAKTFYDGHRSYFWDKVCLEWAGPLPKQAAVVASAHPINGGLTCYTPQQLFEQPSGLNKEVGPLPVGRSGVAAVPGGYDAVHVVSRTTVPYSPSIVNDVEVGAVLGGNQAMPTGDANAISLLKAADVQVNPTYGTWVNYLAAPDPPQVWPVDYGLPTRGS